jgi:hypothetical protein
MTEKQEKRVVGRTVAIALGIICIILAVGLVGTIVGYTSIINGKDNTIATKDNIIATKNSEISDLNNSIATLNNTIHRLEKIENVTNQIFYLRNVIDCDGNWLGSWNLVATFNQYNVSEGKTPNFQIYNRFHLWRLNYSVHQDLWLRVIQANGSLVLAFYQFTYSTEADIGSVYFFADSVYSPISYFIEFPTGSFAGNWTITVEQLE